MFIRLPFVQICTLPLFLKHLNINHTPATFPYFLPCFVYTVLHALYFLIWFLFQLLSWCDTHYISYHLVHTVFHAYCPLFYYSCIVITYCISYLYTYYCFLQAVCCAITSTMKFILRSLWSTYFHSHPASEMPIHSPAVTGIVKNRSGRFACTRR